MRTFLALCLVSTLLSGCASSNKRKETKEDSNLSHSEKLIAWNGVIRQGYMVSLDSNPPGFAYPSEVFASANSELRRKIQKLTGDNHADCFLVPRSYGYDIEIVSKRYLTQKEKDRMKEYIDKALTGAQPEGLRNRSNQAGDDNSE